MAYKTTYDNKKINVTFSNHPDIDTKKYNDSFPHIENVKKLDEEFVRRSKNIKLTETSSTQEVIHNSIYMDIFNNGGWVKSDNIQDMVRNIQEKYYEKYVLPDNIKKTMYKICRQYFEYANIKEIHKGVYEHSITLGFLVIDSSKYLIVCVEYN